MCTFFFYVFIVIAAQFFFFSFLRLCYCNWNLFRSIFFFLKKKIRFNFVDICLKLLSVLLAYVFLIPLNATWKRLRLIYIYNSFIFFFISFFFLSSRSMATLMVHAPENYFSFFSHFRSWSALSQFSIGSFRVYFFSLSVIRLTNFKSNNNNNQNK